MGFIKGLGKYALWISGSIIILIVLALMLQYDRMVRIEAVWDDVVEVADTLPAPAQIVRDQHGVPHISGETDEAVFFAMGYAHAQDRMWQMEFFRRTIQGRWSEVVGPVALEVDGYIRTIGLYRAAQQAVDHLQPDTRAALDAYADGVNTFLAMTDGPPAPEFALLFYEPEPWTPADSISVNKILAVGLGKDALAEPLNGRLAAKLTPEQLAQFLDAGPDGHEGGTTITQPVDYQMILKAVADALPFDVMRGASNSWVMNGNWTHSKEPLLANDPHLGLWAPSVFYLAHQQFPDGNNAVGATVPGMPFIVMGRTDKIAWGFTNGRGDVQDLFVETMVAGKPDHYVTENGPQPLVTRTEVIKDRFGGETPLTIVSTRHGPLLPMKLQELAGLPTDKRVALSWTSLSADDTSIGAGMGILKSNNAGELRSKFHNFVGPQQNIVYADQNGHIGYMAPARIPIRQRPANGWSSVGPGRLPVDGSGTDGAWTGFVPWEGLPQAVDPERGYIVTANNQSVPDDHPYFIASDWEAPYRAERIDEMIRAGGDFQLEDLQNQQRDVTSTAARSIIPALISHATKAQHTDAKLAMEILQAWDYRMDRHQIAPLLYSEWLRQLPAPLFADELGADLFEATASSHRAWFYDQVFNATADSSVARWCDDVTTPAQEGCDVVASAALDKALAYLSDRFGDDINSWRWGDAHIAYHQHQPFGYIPVLNKMFDRKIPSNGGPYTVDRGNTNLKDKDAHLHLHGSAYRAVYDLQRPERSGYMINTGQSGNPFSYYYDNLMPLWRDGELISIPTDPVDYNRISVGTVVLKPAPETD